MSDPKRLLESEADDFERELLSSALNDRGSDRALQRTLVSIGAGAALGVATTAAANAASSALGAATVIKWLGIGALAGLVTAGGLDLAFHGSQAPAGSSTPDPRAAPAQMIAAAEPRPEALHEAPTETPEAPGERATRRSPAPVASAAPEVGPSPPAGPSVGALPAPVASAELLLREVRALDRAKSALSRGDAAGALAALDEHARSFPRAALAPEADVLRVRALVASGNRGAALTIARRLIARQPSSAHARAVSSLLPELGTSNP